MTSPSFETPQPLAGGSGTNNETNTNNNNNPPNLQELILNQMASLTELIKEHNSQGGTIQPMRLDFGGDEVNRGKGKTQERVDEDLHKPFKELSWSPFTRRIVEFSGPSHVMPLNMRLYDGSTDPND